MKRKYIIFSISVPILLLICGCTTNEYQKITVTKEDISFSFEYPATYQNHDETYFSITLLRWDGETLAWDYSNFNTVFSIQIFDQTEEFPDAASYLDACLTNYSEAPDYELFERSKILLSGVEGEFISYKARAGLSGEYINPKTSYFREIYLDYGDKRWVISIDCYQEMVEQVTEEFDHIIKTFRFLN